MLDGYVGSTTGANGSNPFISFTGDPVNMVTGNMYHNERDLSIKGRGGLPIVFERSYNSRDPKDGPLGFGWTHSFSHFLTFYGIEGGHHKVSWTDGSGGEKFFRIPATSGPVPQGLFLNPAGVFVEFRRLAGGTYTIREKNGLTYTFESIDGTVAGSKSRLQTIADRNQNTLTLTYTPNLTSVRDGLNRTITLSYSGSRISEIQDWTGRRFQYEYDGNGNLFRFKNPLAVAGSQPPVVYEYYTAADGLNVNHALKKYTLPRGNGMTFEYYANGKTFRHTNTLGETSTFTYNDFRRETVQVNERGFTRRFFFDAHGNPLTIVEENGGERQYTYDPANPNNRLSSRDPMGYATGYSYDTNGNVTQITLPSGNTVVFSHFTGFNQPGKVKDARGHYTLLKYTTDGKSNLLQEIRLKAGFGAAVDPSTYVPPPSEIIAWAMHTYDTFGNVLSTKRVRDFGTQVGPSLEYDYNDTVNGVQGVNAVVITRRGDKDGDGALDAPDVANLAYDALGRVRTGLRADWYATQVEYDAVDRVIRGTDDVGKTRQYVYDANGNPTGDRLVEPIGGVSTLVHSRSAGYDLSDRPDKRLDAAGNTTTYQYDPAGNVLKVTNPDNYSLAFDYDAANRVIKAFDQEGNAVTRTLDLDGKPRTVTDPNGNTTAYEYYGAPKEGRLKRVTRPKIQAFAQGRATEFDYDANGNVTSLTELPADGGTGRVTLTTYDELNRPTRVVGPVFSDPTFGSIRPVTRYTYSNLGDLVQVAAGRTDVSGTNPLADTVTTQMTYAYDDFGRRIRATDALGKFWRWTYDVHGNVLTQIDAKNQTTSYTWGYGHQLLTRSNPAGNLTYTRNSLGQVVTVANTSPSMTTTYTHDRAFRVKSIADSRGNKTLTYDHSPGGQLNSVSDSDSHTINYVYDPVGRLKSIYAPNSEAIAFAYDPGGRLVQKWFPNGVTSAYRYNPDDSLAFLENRGTASGIASDHTYTYDGFGNRTHANATIAVQVWNWRFSYDGLDRVVQAFWNTGSGESSYARYQYDVLGNRVRDFDDVFGTDNRYSFDFANQLQVWTEYTQGGVPTGFTQTWTHDDNGNLATRVNSDGTTRTYTYDALNRLVGVARSVNPPFDTESYAYDHDGRRIRVTVNGVTTHFLYNGVDTHGEYGPSWGVPQVVYMHGPATDDPLVRLTGPTSTPSATARYYHADALGSAVSVTEPSGGLAEGAGLFDPWGNDWAPQYSLPTVPRYGFTGREPDTTTGLMYYRARYYFPGFGRFTQRDPVDMAGGINAYAYVANNPANLVDPLGLRATDPIDRQIAQASATYVSDVDIGVNDYGDVSGAQLAQFVLPPVRVAPPVPAQGSQSLNQLGGRRDTDPGQQLLNEAGQGIRPPVGITSTGTGTDLVNKMSTEIRGITERTDLGPQGEVYSLRATRGAEYPNVRGGTTRLEVGDVYKFGETSQPDSRYSSTDLQRMGLRYQEEYRGSQTMAKIVEKLRIYGHVLESGQLPPGNRIFR